MSNVPNVNPTVATFISSLKQQFPDLSWPTYLFHYTDVLNAVGILEKGILFSRSAANLSGVLEVDCAGSEVISQTNSRVFDFVRLYFRPSTPPLWHVQGFIPRQEVRRSGVNPCPVPVFLLFDSVRVLSLPGVEFSDANLASPQANIYADPADLGKLDFDQIYHNRAIANDDPHKDWIVKRRCSEVIVPNRLELEPNLRYVVARSSAERELLLNLLDSSTRARLANKVIANGTCCTRRRQYVESVLLSARQIVFRFSIQSSEFNYRYEFESDSVKRVVEKQTAVSKFTWTRPPGDYQVALHIDDHIAYKGQYRHIDSPI